MAAQQRAQLSNLDGGQKVGLYRLGDVVGNRGGRQVGDWRLVGSLGRLGAPLLDPSRRWWAWQLRGWLPSGWRRAWRCGGGGTWAGGVVGAWWRLFLWLSIPPYLVQFLFHSMEAVCQPNLRMRQHPTSMWI